MKTISKECQNLGMPADGMPFRANYSESLLVCVSFIYFEVFYLTLYASLYLFSLL